MRPSILCRERLDRIRRVLERRGGTATVRELRWVYAIRDWEIEQAAKLGWLIITIRKPRVGRPSRVVEFRVLTNAKFPEPRCRIEKAISFRHEMFAIRSALQTVKHGSNFCGFGIPGIVWAYLKVYQPRSRNGAYASTSRLLKRRDVRAAQAWYYALLERDVPLDETMPRTVSGIRERLRELGNWRWDKF